MAFVPIDKLKEGMMLDKDVFLYDHNNKKIPMLKSGQILTQSYINKLIGFEVFGAYISSDGSEDTEKDELFSGPAPVKQELKEEAVSVVKQVYKTFNKSVSDIDEDNIKQTMDVSKELVQALNDKEVKLSIGNLRLYDDYTYNHSLGVAMLSIVIGISLNMKPSELQELGFCGLLHDIGKVSIPQGIIMKYEKLTPEEFELVKQHPVQGAKFFSKQKLVSKRIYEGILTHHEKYDGTGYPNKIRGKGIPLFGRIIAVADVYDALTSVRPYRQSSSAREAIEYIMGSSGSAFDIDIVKAFLRSVAPYPIGSCVKLSNGQLGVIVAQNELQPLRPIIRLFSQPNVLLDLYGQHDLQNVTIENAGNISPDQL